MTKGKGFDLKQDVLDELEWNPEVDASRIGVSVEGDVITLTGHVRSYAEKWNAEKIAKHVHGVKALANDIEVGLAVGDQRDDTEIAQSALSALNWNYSIPKDGITVTVAKGWVTLEGQVDWNYQKRAADDVVRHLRGIRGVSNQITLKPHVQVADVKNKIEAALRRNAEFDAKKIVVETSDSSVTLRGNVRSWVEREDAVNAAWAAPGVTKVVDRIAIQV
jgi:osmotically-inducible protein OsmY